MGGSSSIVFKVVPDGIACLLYSFLSTCQADLVLLNNFDHNVICFFLIGTILILNFSVGNPDFVYGLDWKNAIAKTSRICYRIIA